MVQFRREDSALERWEVSLVKAMQERGGYNDQKILSYFTRPTRTVNHRLIGQIRREDRYKSVKKATPEELDEFLTSWPDVDSETGLSLRGDELLIKAREAMISAVHSFNGAGLTFRSELFIVTAIIAWTYLMHSFFKREGIDYRYYKTVDGVKQIDKTPEGADKYWELAKCIRQTKCPLPEGTVNNLKALLEIRHEIEHRSTNRIDDALSAKLQQCCLNFNESIKEIFGNRYGLEKRLSMALQFVTFSSDQRAVLKRSGKLPRHIETSLQKIHERLTDEELADPRFSYHVAFVRKVANRASAADEAVEFVSSDSSEGREINRVLLKETEKPKYRPSDIVKMIKDGGHPRFNIAKHTSLWQALKAKSVDKPYGVEIAGQWYWYEAWLARVREHCNEHQSEYV
jgi:hypothetical protein